VAVDKLPREWLLEVDNRTITTLALDKNVIGDAGATALASALQENNTVKTILLWDNKIGDKGKGAFRAVKEVRGDDLTILW